MKNAVTGDKFNKRDKFLLIAGFIFFCNPVIGMVDILPDAVGALLMLIGLDRLTYVSDYFARARKMMLWLLAFGSLKLILTVPVLASGISTNSMTAVMVSVVCEVIIFALFFRAWFGGVDEMLIMNGLVKTDSRFGGARFWAWLFLAVRAFANLAPELFALAEVDRNAPELSFDEVDFLNDLLSARAVIVAGCVLLFLVIGVVFAIKQGGLISAFFAEAGGIITAKYTANYSSSPDKVALRRIKYAFYCFNVASLFSFDIIVDDTPVLPPSVMFLLIFLGAVILSPISDFRQTRISSLTAVVAFMLAQIYRSSFVVRDPVVLYETKPGEAVISLAVAVIASTAGLISIRFLSADMSALAKKLGADYDHTKLWSPWCIATLLWTASFVLPYLVKYLYSPRFAVLAYFTYYLWRQNGIILDSERKRISML